MDWLCLKRAKVGRKRSADRRPVVETRGEREYTVEKVEINSGCGEKRF
jgi:hypothetical protein